MKIRRTVFALALLLMMCAAVMLPGTLAYISAKTGSITNTFTARHVAPLSTSVDVKIRKTIRNEGFGVISPEGFRFVIKREDNGEITRLTSGRDGTAAAAFLFDENDVGNTYEYRVYEVNDHRPGVVYDETVHTLTITLALDEQNHAVTASVKVNGKDAPALLPFRNAWLPDMAVPLTGDETPVALCAALLLLSLTGMLLLRRKARQ